MLSSASLRTFVLLCVVAGIDRADQQLLPSVYLEVCGEFHVGPSALGLVTFCCGLAQSLVAAFAGPLGSRMDRIQLIAVGTVWWGVSSILVGASTTLSALLVARTLNGLGLGLVMPLVFAVVADLIPEAHHGRFFGVVSFAGMAGGSGGVLGGCPVFYINNGDYLTFPDGSRHSGADCPAGSALAAGQTLSWHSDSAGKGTNEFSLWQVCFA